MSLVDPPGFYSFGVIAETHCLEKERACLGCSDEHRCVSHVEVVTSFLKEVTCFFSFPLSSLVEWNIDPTAEFSRFIPDRLSVSDKHNFIGGLLFDEWVSRSHLEVSEGWSIES